LTPTVIEELRGECDRVRRIIVRREALPGDVTWFGVFWMKALVKRAGKAIADSNANECANVLQQLREVEP
jgi:hypothetical protein